MPEQVGKSYNPFKMWGSWAGLVVALVCELLASGQQSTLRDLAVFVVVNSNPLLWFSWPLDSYIKEWGLAAIGIVIVINAVTTPVFFFIYGWGIHSLLRKLISKQATERIS